jgi:hypothetical protein
MEKTVHEFTAVQSLQLENSYAVLKKENNVTLHCTVGFNSEDYGWFEIYDEESRGDEWYAEGGLWFDGKDLTDYDGVFSLPDCILAKLKELGYNVEDFI